MLGMVAQGTKQTTCCSYRDSLFGVDVVLGRGIRGYLPDSTGGEWRSRGSREVGRRLRRGRCRSVELDVFGKIYLDKR
jgi:hypothetical protein